MIELLLFILGGVGAVVALLAIWAHITDNPNAAAQNLNGEDWF